MKISTNVLNFEYYFSYKFDNKGNTQNCYNSIFSRNKRKNKKTEKGEAGNKNRKILSRIFRKRMCFFVLYFLKAK